MSDATPRLNAALEGRYSIERELGEGGMATVYLAHDERHDRPVAVKVLKPELAAVIGAERFLGEIKTTANLQHPHILPLFDSGEADGFLFYVMPFVEGETLRQKIDREKQLPIDEAVTIAGAIAGALDYAHRHGVIHRDIKPANILLHEGQPLVADFGIALAVSAAGGGRLTATGLSLGTPHYMSPEQASADRDLTAHSDVYALACVTYEMLVGAPPFSGPTAQAVLMQILTEEAKPVTATRKSVPTHIEATLAKALEKLPADRFVSADAFASALRDPGATEAFRRSTDEASSTGRRRGRLGHVLWPALTLAAVGVAAIGWSRGDRAPAPVVRFKLLDSGGPVPALFQARRLALSPDGGHVAYASTNDAGRVGLYVRPLDELEPALVYQGAAESPMFSPDGRLLAFNAGRDLKVISMGGGAARLLADSVFYGADWAADGYIYYLDVDSRLVRIPEGGGERELLFETGDDGVVVDAPSVLPDGDAAIVTISTGRAGGEPSFAVLDFASGTLDTLGLGSLARLFLGEYVLWLTQDGTLYVAPFEPDTREMGSGVALLSGVDIGRFGGASLSVSESGSLVYQVSGGEEGNLVAVSRGGVRVQRNLATTTSLGFRLSPDGGQITFEEGFSAIPDVWVMDLGSGVRTRITFDATAYYPAWTPDGIRVAYYRVIDGEYDLWWKNADGSGVEESLLKAPGRAIEVAFLPDGKHIIVRQGDRARVEGSDIFVYRIGDPDSARPIANTAGNEVSPMISPGGRYVAYASDELGTQEVFVRSIDNPEERWQVSTDGGWGPYWHPDGTEIYYMTATDLRAVPISVEPTFRRLGPPEALFSVDGLSSNANHTSYALLPDGQTFLFIEEASEPETVVVLNWIEEVRAALGR